MVYLSFIRKCASSELVYDERLNMDSLMRTWSLESAGGVQEVKSNCSLSSVPKPPKYIVYITRFLHS